MAKTTQKQKKKYRDKNRITTIQLSVGNKERLGNVMKARPDVQKYDEALDEVLSLWEDVEKHGIKGLIDDN